LFATTARHWPVVVAACPFKALVQALQPVQALSQQTPSATTLDVHSLPFVAGAPLLFVAAHFPTELSQ
jgi:hypothetical protein